MLVPTLNVTPSGQPYATYTCKGSVSQWVVDFLYCFASISLPPLSCLPATSCPVLFFLFLIAEEQAAALFLQHREPEAACKYSCKCSHCPSPSRQSWWSPLTKICLSLVHLNTGRSPSHTSANGYTLLCQMRPEALFVSVHKVSPSTQHCNAHPSPAIAYVQVLPISLLQKHSVPHKHKLTYRYIFLKYPGPCKKPSAWTSSVLCLRVSWRWGRHNLLCT